MGKLRQHFIADGQIPPAFRRAGFLGDPSVDLQSLSVKPFCRGQIALGITDIPQFHVTDGQIPAGGHRVGSLSQLRGDRRRLLKAPLCSGQIALIITNFDQPLIADRQLLLAVGGGGCLHQLLTDGYRLRIILPRLRCVVIGPTDIAQQLVAAGHIPPNGR